jgi:magnesium chelatase subunit H
MPETVAIVLWGTDNLKNEGAPIAQALALMGAQPRFDSYGRLVGAQLTPLEQLGRPRIDVMCTLSGIFRDLLPLQIKLLAEAAYLAAIADEPVEQNFIRKHALAHQAEHGCDMETASLRVFGNADGAYGSNVNHLVENSRWDEEDELAETYTRRKSFAYGVNGKPTQQTTLLNNILTKVDFAYQNLDSVELGVTTVDHYFDTLGGISRAVRRAKGERLLPSISVTKPVAKASCAHCRNRFRWKPAPGCSTPNGMMVCSVMVMRAFVRLRNTSPTPSVGRLQRARCSLGSTSN